MSEVAIWFWGGVLALGGIIGAAVMIIAELREAEDDGAADPPAVVVRDTRKAPAHVGPRLRWESDLALHAVQCDQTARLERRKREAADIAIFRAVKRSADVAPIRGER